jgi:hypothetical protein
MLSDEELQGIAPFPLVWVPGERVSEAWSELRRRPGVAPLLLGNPESAAVLLKVAQLATESAEAVVERALKLDVDAWMAGRMRARPDLYDLREVDRPWDGVRRSVEPFVPSHDHRGDPYPDVIFGLIPAEFPWLVPTHLRTSGVANCPDSAVHTALSRRWYERHGAVMTTIADGVIEFQVERPLATLELARQVALEHFVYCPDVVHQGMVTLGNSAAALMTNHTWYFWWELDVHERPD